MPRNIEIKARIASVEALLPLARACADGPPELILQDDTFYPCPRGRSQENLAAKLFER